MDSDLFPGLVEQEASDSESVDSFPELKECVSSELVFPTNPLNPQVKGRFKRNLERIGELRPSSARRQEARARLQPTLAQLAEAKVSPTEYFRAQAQIAEQKAPAQALIAAQKAQAQALIAEKEAKAQVLLYEKIAQK